MLNVYTGNNSFHIFNMVFKRKKQKNFSEIFYFAPVLFKKRK